MNFEVDESRVSKYGVDLIGQIDANLTHLRGYGVMALELIQNADDAGASEISIDITDKALIIKNNAEFSSCANRQNVTCLRGEVTGGDMCDWHAFRLIASRAKSERSQTTIGRFGLGFTSVYQITDNPEVECSGSKLIIHPETETSIWKKTENTSGTTFTLPWAFDPDGPVRSQLKNVGVITREAISIIQKEINETSSETLVFLKNLKHISILHNGKIKSSFSREITEDENYLKISHEPSGKVREYFYISKNFSSSLIQLEMKFPRDLGKKNRRHQIEIAIPKEFDTAKSGLIYAYLPTERNTLMPMSINGDFYPDMSRKDIILSRKSGNDALSEWNRAIIELSATLFNSHLEDIYKFLGYQKFWKLAQSIFVLYEQTSAYGSDISDCFASFWTRFSLFAPSLSILPMEGREDEPQSIEKSYLLESDDIQDKRKAIRILEINSPSSKIKFQYRILKKLDIEELNFNIIINSLNNSRFVQMPKQQVTISSSEYQDAYSLIYSLLDSFIPRESASMIFKQSLEMYMNMPILISHDENVVRPSQTFFSSSQEVFDLATKLDPNIKFLNPELSRFTRIRESCNEFCTSDAINLIAELVDIQSPISTETLLEIHRLLIRVTEKTALSKVEIDGIKTLKIWPTSTGLLINAEHGMIPGDFSDPLGTAQLIDTSKINSKVINFLKDTLQVRTMSLQSYVENILPNIFSLEQNPISVDSYHKLLEELSKNHKQFENAELVSKMNDLLFIPTQNGVFQRIRNSANADSVVKKRLSGIFDDWFDSNYFPESPMVRRFLETLGLRKVPESKVLGSALKHVISENPDQKNRQKAIKIIDFLTDKSNSYSDQEIADFFLNVSATGFLPAKNDFEYWHQPFQLLAPEVFDLVASQTHLKFLDFSGVDPSSKDLFVAKCGIVTEPAIEDVIAHVESCVEADSKVSKRILKHLNKVASRKADEETIELLRSLRDLAFLPSTNGNFRPADLYWELHKIGAPWAYLVPKEFDYPELLSVLGVKQTPDGGDIINILGRIKESHDENNEKALPDDVRIAYLQCWELLNSFFQMESLDEQQIFRLKYSDYFLNMKFEFKSRNELVIADSNWLRTDFESELSKYFVLDDHVYNDILERLEFKSLSQSIEATLLTIGEPMHRHSGIRELIAERAENIAAVLNGRKKTSNQAMEWTSLDVYQTGPIEVNWSLHFEEETVSIVKPANVFADFNLNKLYVTNAFTEIDDDFNWARMLTELFNQLFPAETDLSGFVAKVSRIMELSPQKGLAYLLDIGVAIERRTASIDFSRAVIEEVQMADNQDTEGGEDQAHQEEQESETRDQTQIGQNNLTAESSNSISNDSIPKPTAELKSSEHRDRTQTDRSEASKRQEDQKAVNDDKYFGNRNQDSENRNPSERPRPTVRANNLNKAGEEIREAFIYIQREPTDDGAEAQKDKMNTESISRRIVIDHEILEGRMPEEMSPNNPGYDIESTQTDGNIRYIEIKSTKSLWGRDGVTLSNAQLNMAYIKKDAFWLYVIEKIGLGEPIIYKIQDPARHIRGFKLNDAWKEIAESLEYAANSDEIVSTGINSDDIGCRILHIERGECFLVGWREMGSSVLVTLQFDDLDEHVVLPLNIIKMKKLGN